MLVSMAIRFKSHLLLPQMCCFHFKSKHIYCWKLLSAEENFIKKEEDWKQFFSHFNYYRTAGTGAAYPTTQGYAVTPTATYGAAQRTAYDQTAAYQQAAASQGTYASKFSQI